MKKKVLFFIASVAIVTMGAISIANAGPVQLQSAFDGNEGTKVLMSNVAGTKYCCAAGSKSCSMVDCK